MCPYPYFGHFGRWDNARVQNKIVTQKLNTYTYIDMNKYRYLLILHFPSFVIVYYNNFLLSLENLLARRKQHTCCILLKSCIISLCKQQEFIQNFSRHLLRIL